MIKFSIIVPCYKDLFLDECINSILAQTYDNFELILVNDGSPYDLDKIIESYRDDRIRYYKREKGLGAKCLVENWNDCVKYAIGEYIIMMGDDDKLLPNCLQDYIYLIEKYPTLDIYHMRLEYINEEGNVISLQKDGPDWETVYSLMWNCWFGGRPIAIGECLYKAKALRTNGGYYNIPYAWHSDRISAFIMATKTGIANTHIPGFQFRMSSYEISSDIALTEEKIRAWYEAKNWYKIFFVDKPADIEDLYYYKSLKSNLTKFVENEILGLINYDMSISRWHVFRWFRKAHSLGLSIRILGITFYNFLLKFKKNKNKIFRN